MKIKNVEIKARCARPQQIRDTLISAGAVFQGRDHQVDTYYRSSGHRLKLRRGNIENALIAYDRENVSDPKRSDILLYKTADAEGLKEILDATFDTHVVVDKQRDIYFLGNVKFHVDDVLRLGTFVEIEAIDEQDAISVEDLRAQCKQCMMLLGITDADLLTHSYSDMIAEQS